MDASTLAAFASIGRAIGTHHVRWPLAPYQRRGVVSALITSIVPRWGVRGHINALEMGLGKTLIEIIHAIVWRSITPDTFSPWLDGVGAIERERVSVFIKDILAACHAPAPTIQSPMARLLLYEMKPRRAPVHLSTLVVSENVVHASWIENMTKHVPRIAHIVEYDRAKAPDVQTAPFLFITYSLLGGLAGAIQACDKEHGWSARLDSLPTAQERDALRARIRDTLRAKDPAMLVFATEWNLVVMDEAHNARTPSSAIWRGVSSLSARATRIVTGTMVNNQLSDLSVLFGLLGCEHPYVRAHAAVKYSKSDDMRARCGLTLDACTHATVQFCNVREHDMAADVLTPSEAAPAIWLAATTFLPWSHADFLKCVQRPYVAWELPAIMTWPRARHVSSALEAAETALGLAGPVPTLVSRDARWDVELAAVRPSVDWVRAHLTQELAPRVANDTWRWSDLPCASPLDARRVYARAIVASLDGAVDWAPVVIGYRCIEPAAPCPSIDRAWCLNHPAEALVCIDRYLDMVQRLEQAMTTLVDALCDAVDARDPAATRILDDAARAVNQAMQRKADAVQTRRAAKRARPAVPANIFQKEAARAALDMSKRRAAHLRGLTVTSKKHTSQGEDEEEEEEEPEEKEDEEEKMSTEVPATPMAPLRGAPGIIQFIVRPDPQGANVDVLVRREIERCLMASIERVREGMSQSYGDMLACNTYAQTASVHPDALRYHVGRTRSVIELLGEGTSAFAAYARQHPVPHDDDVDADVAKKMTAAQLAEREAWFEAAHTRCESVKMKFLNMYMRHNVQPDEKVVIFSRYRGCIAILRGYVEQVLGFRTMTLRSRESAESRHAALLQFNSSSPEASKVLFVNTRGNGVGINITRANHAFVFDPWYNPRLDDQALMRIHRPGQTRYTWRCVVISHGSYEHAIYLLGAEKAMIGYHVTGSKSQQRRHLEVDATRVENILPATLRARIDAMEMTTATATDIAHTESSEFSISKRIMGLARERMSAPKSSSANPASDVATSASPRATVPPSPWVSTGSPLAQLHEACRMHWSLELGASIVPPHVDHDTLVAAATSFMSRHAVKTSI